MKKIRYSYVLVCCFLCAAAALLFTSTCSPIFATSFWTDTNIYFTMGRGIRHGLMPYRDLYDHKGPLLYFLYSLAAWVSESSFIGVYLMEIAALGLTCFLSYKISEIFVKGHGALLSIPLTAMICVSCTAFNQGGSAEELCLPALAYAVYAYLELFETEDKTARSILFGMTAGFVFLIKFTVCGLHFGLGIAAFLYLAACRGIRTAAEHGLKWIAGFLMMFVPIMLLLILTGILAPCIQAYFWDNVNVYEGTPLTLTGHVYNALAYLRTQSAINPAVFLLTVLGFLYLGIRTVIRRRKENVFELLGYLFSAGLFLLFVYWGEMAHPYYALVFAACICPGMVPLTGILNRLDERSEKKILVNVSFLLLILAILPVSAGTSRVIPLLSVKREQMPQKQFAKEMQLSAGESILDVTSLDQGFYLGAGVLPACRYFSDNNLPSKEKEQEIKRYLSEAVPKYVVSIYRDPGDRYELIDEAEGLFDLADLRHYRLYQRIQ